MRLKIYLNLAASKSTKSLHLNRILTVERGSRTLILPKQTSSTFSLRPRFKAFAAQDLAVGASKGADDVDAGGAGVFVFDLAVGARAEGVEERGSGRAASVGAVANNGAAAFLVLARDGATSAVALAVLCRNTKGEDGDGKDGGELHVCDVGLLLTWIGEYNEGS